MKPGTHTTEFWIVLLMILCQAALAWLDKLDKSWASAGMTLAALLYTVLRSALKRAAMR